MESYYNNIKLTLLLFITSFSCYAAVPQNKPIGFKTLEIIDYSQKNIKKPEAYLPVQLSIWYPSTGDEKDIINRD